MSRPSTRPLSTRRTIFKAQGFAGGPGLAGPPSRPAASLPELLSVSSPRPASPVGWRVPAAWPTTALSSPSCACPPKAGVTSETPAQESVPGEFLSHNRGGLSETTQRSAARSHRAGLEAALPRHGPSGEIRDAGAHSPPGEFECPGSLRRISVRTSGEHRTQGATAGRNAASLKCSHPLNIVG